MVCRRGEIVVGMVEVEVGGGEGMVEDVPSAAASALGGGAVAAAMVEKL